MSLKEFQIIPVLGRKTDVPQNDPTLFKDYSGNIATHDVGGVNFDLSRKRNVCARANGYSLWSNTANATATRCLGLFELYAGGNRDHLFADDGVIYVFDSSRDPGALTNVKVGFDSGGTEPTIGETVSENGGDASGVLAAYEVTSGTWGGGDAAGTLYIQTSTGTWTDDAQLDGTTSGADFATEDGAASADTFAKDNNYNLYSMIRVGNYFVFADRATTTPHKWKNSDQSLTPLITSGTFYKFRYLVSFARRVIGLYCTDDTNAPELSVRWSSAWPATTISNLTFSSGSQLYIPNDDPIVGGATMGSDRCFIYCENSIQQLAYYPDFETPFGCITVVPQIGASSHHSIVNLGSMHLFFNKQYGFMRYTGGGDPIPISDDIRSDIDTINSDYTNLIVGCYVPDIRCAIWTVPMYGASTPNRLVFYQVDTGQWFIINRAMRYLDYWRTYSSYTWQDLIRDFGGLEKARGTADTDTENKLVDSAADFVTAGVVVGDEAHNTTDGTYAAVTAVATTELTLGTTDAFPDGDENYEVGTGATWSDAGSRSWAEFTSLNARLVYANTDGHIYSHYSETDPSSTELDGYRIEPILDFGDPKRKDLLQEIWFQTSYYGTHSIDIYHRSGDTVAECVGSSWTNIGSIALNTNKPVVYLEKSARLHQIKWGTDSDAEYFEVNKIIFKYSEQSEN